MKRFALSAAVATVVLACAAAAVWIVFVRSVAGAMSAQARTAADLLAADVPVGEGFARALLRPGVHVLAADRRARVVVDAGSNGVHMLPVPPGASLASEPPPRAANGAPNGAPPGASPGAPPAAGNGAPPGAQNGAPAGAENGAPPRASADGMPPDSRRNGVLLGVGPPRHGPAGTLALSLARLAPLRIERGDRTVEIAPDVRVLSIWLTADALLLLAGIVAVGGITASRSAAFVRGQRRALESRAAERAAAAERYQRFLAEAGHELRTPLTVLAGYVDILRARDGAAPLDERVVDGMHAETSRMRALVEKMMTLARLESEAAVPRLLDVASAAHEAAQTLRRRYPSRTVCVHAEQTASIIIDADDYAAALGNILENAVKYAPRSPVVIETAVHDGRASTAVIDRGRGIPPDERDAIFEQFYRGHDGGEGLGLGLAIVKRVADRWNGSVDCESGDGRTVFRLTFPLADEEHDVVAR